MTPSELVKCINSRHHTSFTLKQRYATGEQGAFQLEDEHQHQYVLKYAIAQTQLGEAEVILQHLRYLGYPVPGYLFSGVINDAGYLIQQALPGNPLPVLPVTYLPQVLELNQLQRGQVLKGPYDWPQRIIQTVLYGGEGYCLLNPLKTYSEASASLLARLHKIVQTQTSLKCRTQDIVHFDFTPANILVDQDKISGVIDWQDPCAGDCTFDLVTLMFYSFDQPAMWEGLKQTILARIEASLMQLYLAHLVLRQVDWSIRHHTQERVNYWLIVAEAALQL
jgi:aminoglycoside phosphotransferase